MLGYSPLPRTLEAALADLAHADTAVRVSALKDLARHADGAERARVIAAVARVLARDPAPGLRAEAAVVLADVEAVEALHELLAAERDPAPRVRQMALLALGEIARAADLAEPELRRVVTQAAQATAAQDPALRFQGLIALARLAPEQAASTLRSALRDDDAEVRYIAVRLTEDLLVADEVPEPQRVALERALGDAAPAVRLAAAIALSRRGHTAARDVLVAALDAREALDVEDEQAAIDLAGELGLTRARQALERRAFGFVGGTGRFTWHARVALARLGDARARRAIVRGLTAWTRDARTHAVVAAGRARIVEARAALLALQGRPERADPAAVSQALGELTGLGPGDP